MEKVLGSYAALLSREERTSLHRHQQEQGHRSIEERSAAAADGGRMEITPLLQQRAGV